MKLSEIYAFLDKLSPFDTQEAWDNSGLLLGNADNEINTVYLSLDIDENLLEKAQPNSLFITHHPLIFKGLKELGSNAYPRAFIKEMIRKNIALISMHTNYDKSHLNAYFVEEILGFKLSFKEGFLAYVDCELSFDELIAHLKLRLDLKQIHTSFAGKKELKRLAICTGSGGDLIPFVKADCFLSGDFKYHQACQALANKLSLIDIKHYESEICFANSLAKHLQSLPINAIISVCKNPFQYF
ncbi:Nif3-like dinuclear metal center hexameric protein [Campylobacter sp. MIT 12-5580]|uniref:Nif3-like dinuclear metal center hexameric protein n=1 Tax=Campylobacter sp. MIT 12-5580 TaxID=2040651 RepID=UPI0010FA2225|nr:Nif3-like dinuclear metal center hexameric protein [Campylobacter sp. MIT 12-5580]TKX28747.1 Nif3-like dinuclear metal center hexameric protein [Campylobacter sp. MIT 12-5580]